MFLRGDYWHYDFIVGGIRYRGSTGYKKNEKKKAEDAVARLRVQVKDGHSIEMVWEQTKRKLMNTKELQLDFNEIWNAFCLKGHSNAKSRRVKTYELHINTFCKWMKEHYPSVKTASKVYPQHVQEWIANLKQEGGASSTINDYLSTLKMVFKGLGYEYGIVDNPFLTVKKQPVSKVIRETFTPEELALIGQRAKGWIYSLCITAMSTGLREGDICLMKKSAVNLNTGWLSIHTKKTGAVVEIPILPGLRKHLEYMMNKNKSEYVYPELARRYKEAPNSIGPKIKDFFEEIGITGTKQEVEGYKKAVSVKDVHSFRHTFIYLAACHGIPFPIVQGIVGHTTPEMTKHYMEHAGREEKAEYMKKLPDYITEKEFTIVKAPEYETLKLLIDEMTLDEVKEVMTFAKSIFERTKASD